MTHNQVNQVSVYYDDRGSSIDDHGDNWYDCLRNSLPKDSLWKRILKRMGLIKTDAEAEWKKVEKEMCRYQQYCDKCAAEYLEHKKKAEEIRDGTRFGFDIEEPK